MNTLAVRSVMPVAQGAAQGELAHRDYPDVVFKCEFESDTWFRQWGAAKSPKRTQRCPQ